MRWERNKFYDISAMAKLPELLDKDEKFALMLVKDSDRKVVNTCREYLKLKSENYEPENNASIAEESTVKFRCGSLEWAAKAKPSKESYVDRFKFGPKVLSELPAGIGGTGGDSGYREELTAARKANKSFASFSKHKVTKSTSNELTVADPGEVISMTVVARGDHDGDGAEDLLLFVSTHATQGSFHSYEFVTLTRKAKETVLRVIE